MKLTSRLGDVVGNLRVPWKTLEESIVIHPKTQRHYPCRRLSQYCSMSFRRTSPVFGRCVWVGATALIRWLVVGVSGLALVDAENCHHRSYILVSSADTFRYKRAERILCLLRRMELAVLVVECLLSVDGVYNQAHHLTPSHQGDQRVLSE